MNYQIYEFKVIHYVISLDDELLFNIFILNILLIRINKIIFFK